MISLHKDMAEAENLMDLWGRKYTHDSALLWHKVTQLKTGHSQNIGEEAWNYM